MFEPQMKLFLLVVISLFFISLAHAFLQRPLSSKRSASSSLQRRFHETDTSLSLDFFGFGPAEIGVVAIVGLVLFGYTF